MFEVPKPPPPRPVEPIDWPHYELWKRIKKILEELPNRFKSTLNIVTAVSVTEIYTYSAALSQTVEEEVVVTLNNAKNEWDPDNMYCDYYFIRQAQSFPDVLLKNIKENNPLMGIELKTWYLLAKEEEPSFRYKVTPAACAVQDLLVVVPWVLSNVFTGSPIIFRPFIISAKYAAEYRNYWWKYLRDTSEDTGISSPDNVKPYPSSRQKIDDEPNHDPGNNFGRLARTEIMDKWVEECKKKRLLGIEIKKWIEFLKTSRAKNQGPSVNSSIDMMFNGKGCREAPA
jgi:hypothetical protein